MDIKSLLGLPDVLDVNKVIAIQPHPDDNEVNIAGTLLELSKRDIEIIYITVTDGRAGAFGNSVDPSELVSIRHQEKIEAGNIIGVNKHVDLGFRDGGSYSIEELTKQLVYLYRKFKPDLVFTVDPWMPYEAHPDHIKVGMAASQALIFSNNEIYYPARENEPSYQVPQIAFYATSHPNTFIDVSSHWPQKLDSIFAHTSQFDNAKWDILKMYFEYQGRQTYALKYGNENGMAEGLKVLAAVQLHSFPSALYS
jgi:N,N'-diacetylchitobiose non-reducing end deacetylase